ncbi:MAG TPA: PLP-dependent aspartate aminotransferase family protein [Candidatus Limnocylindrales bacterium]
MTNDDRGGDRAPGLTQGFATRAIHAGETPDPATRAHNTPIYMTATFTFDTGEEKEAAVDSSLAWQGGYFYSRTGNPTTSALEAKLASLEGAEDAVVGASGMAALASLVYSVVRAGDHLLVADDIFAISRVLISDDLPRRGVDVSAVDITDLDAVRAALRPNTRAIVTEVLSNPFMRIADIPALAAIAHSHGAKLLVDNTFLSPYVYRPLPDGADAVVHSATKYLAGHGDALAGVVAGAKSIIDGVRYHLDAIGGAASPFNSWLVMRGVRTLPLRMEAHSRNGQALAGLLASHPAVEWVRYPGHPSHPDFATAERLLGDRRGGMMTVKIRGGATEMYAFTNATRLCSIAVSLGDLYTLVYPMPKRGDIVRISTGCEDREDILADVGRALDAVPLPVG